MSYFLFKWFVAAPLLLVCGVFFVTLSLLGVIGWLCANLAGGAFGFAAAVVNKLYQFERKD